MLLWDVMQFLSTAVLLLPDLSVLTESQLCESFSNLFCNNTSFYDTTIQCGSPNLNFRFYNCGRMKIRQGMQILGLYFCIWIKPLMQVVM